MRAKWQKEEGARGTYQIVVTEIPYQVQKSQAGRAARRADPDEQGAAARRCARRKRRRHSPRPRAARAHRRAGSADGDSVQALRSGSARPAQPQCAVARSMADHSAARACRSRKRCSHSCAHRQDVLVRRTQHRLAKIEDRLEILGGYLIAYLNLDEVIRIIRYEDEPKQELMKAFKLTDRQAEAILNMRLRISAQARRDGDQDRGQEPQDRAEGAEGAARLRRAAKGQARRGSQGIKDKFGQKTALGKRRTAIADAPVIDHRHRRGDDEREPITVICSEKGWIRTMKGHVPLDADAKYKEGDRGKFWLHDGDDGFLDGVLDRRPLLHAVADKLPGGRGMGEPIRLMIDLDQRAGYCRRSSSTIPSASCLSSHRRGHGFRREGVRMRRDQAHRQAGAQCSGRRRSRVCVRRRRQSCRDHRREPQAAAVPARRSAGDDARQGRAVAAL